MTNPFTERVVASNGRASEHEFALDIREHWSDPGGLNQIAEALGLIGAFHGAIVLYQRIVEISPSWIDMFDQLARAHWAVHEYSRARHFWLCYLDARRHRYATLELSPSLFTVDDVFTSAFGNFAHLYPIHASGYLADDDDIYFHPPSAKSRSTLPASHEDVLSNSYLRDVVFSKFDRELPIDLQRTIAADDYITRLPFYCGLDGHRRPSHFHAAFAERTLLALYQGHSYAQLDISSEQQEQCVNALRDLGVDPGQPFVCLHCRESGYWGRGADRTHSTKNANIDDYMPAVEWLVQQGYTVVRLGDPTMRKAPSREGLVDYANSVSKSPLLDLYLLDRAEFLICTCSGPYAVATIFGTPVLGTNWIPVHILPFMPNDLVLLKTITSLENGTRLSFRDMLLLNYGEFSYYNLAARGLEVRDNSPAEILSATCEMAFQIREGKRAVRNPFSLAEAARRRWSFGKVPIVSQARFASSSRRPHERLRRVASLIGAQACEAGKSIF